MPEQVIPKAANVEETLTSLHTQLYLMRSQLAVWQCSSTPPDRLSVEDENTEKTLSLIEKCCQMDWEIGQNLLAVLRAARAGYEQMDSSSPKLMGTPSPMLSKSLPNAAAPRHPSSVLAGVSASITAN